MNRTFRQFTSLGMGALASAVTLAACAPGAPEDLPAAAQDAPPAVLEPVPVSGEGEGGIDVARAGTDRKIFLMALAVAEAHVLAARDAYAAGETTAAAEMFAHPVSEVLFEMAPAFATLGIPSMDDLFSQASAAALEQQPASTVEAHTDAILAALSDAAGRGPASSELEARLQVQVIADQIERAVRMYRAAAATETYGPYLDGYGFYKCAEALHEASRARIAEQDAEAVTAVDLALAALKAAYPQVLRPTNLDADQSALTVAAAKAALAASN